MLQEMSILYSSIPWSNTNDLPPSFFESQSNWLEVSLIIGIENIKSVPERETQFTLGEYARRP